MAPKVNEETQHIFLYLQQLLTPGFQHTCWINPSLISMKVWSSEVEDNFDDHQ